MNKTTARGLIAARVSGYHLIPRDGVDREHNVARAWASCPACSRRIEATVAAVAAPSRSLLEHMTYQGDDPDYGCPGQLG